MIYPLDSFVQPLNNWAQESSFNLRRVLVCFLLQFDLLFAFGVLSCRILDSASLFILYVLDHNRLGFWMLTLETAYLIAFVDLVPAATEKVSLIRSNIVWNRWKSTLRAGSIRTTERKCKILSTLIIRPGEILELVAPSLFTMNARTRWQIFTYI